MLDFTRGKLKNQTGEQSNATLLSHLSFFKTRFSNQSYIYNIYNIYMYIQCVSAIWSNSSWILVSSSSSGWKAVTS